MIKKIILPLEDYILISGETVQKKIADNNVIDCLDEVSDNCDCIVDSVNNVINNNKIDKKDLFYINQLIGLLLAIQQFNK